MRNNWENTPDWVLFVAKDSDGGWYGYSEKPAIANVGIQLVKIMISFIEMLMGKIGKTLCKRGQNE